MSQSRITYQTFSASMTESVGTGKFQRFISLYHSCDLSPPRLELPIQETCYAPTLLAL